jgi:hypothetical protein
MSTNERSFDKRSESDGHKQQPPNSRPPRFRLHLHLDLEFGLGFRAASLVNVPPVLLNAKIIVLVSNSSSICMEARTGAVDVRAEQRLEQ